MKQKLLGFFVLGILLIGSAYAQEKRISGKVISSEDSSPLPGVTVTAVGSQAVTQTNLQGDYTLVVPASATQLQFTFIGFETQVVALGSGAIINVTLSPGAATLEEVVVTGAYGTQQTARSISYSAQVLQGDDVNVTRQPNVNNALAGKVAGLQVRSQSAAALGRETAVRLRGASGFGGGQGAIYVVDGTILPNSDDLNLDDIASISVLQGPAASAQFGSQGANGAIVITLKRGRKSSGMGIVMNLGAQFENPYIMPNYQNSYAGGGASSLIKYTWQPGQPEEWKALDGKFYHDYNDDASWGPRMVGQEYIPWYAWYGGHSRSFQTAKLTPQPDNARDFYETGVLLNNSISFSTATDNVNLKLTYGNQSINGLIPTSKLGRNNINMILDYDINKYLTLSTNVNYINQRLYGEIDDDYSNQSTGAFSQWFHRNLDMGILKELRGLTTPDGIYASWNKTAPTSYNPANERNFYAGNYWYNPYVYYDLIDMINQRDRLFGHLSLTYHIMEGLNVSATYRKQQNTTFWEDKYSSRLNESGLQTQGNNAQARGYYGTGTSYSNRQNLEFLANYSKTINDFSIEGHLGSDFFHWVSKSNSANTNQGLNVPDLFTIANSVNDATISNGRTEERYNAIFGSGVFGYQNMVFVNFSLRNDWFSTLPADNNSVLSKSVGGSFIFSDLLPTSSWFGYGKLRAGWGEIPKALGVRSTEFGAYRYPGFAYGVGQFKWGSNFLMGTPDQLVDPNIRGSVVSQMDVGLDLGFFRGSRGRDRLGLSFTYWDGSEIDFPQSLSLNGASGFTSILTNIGKVTKKGIDLQLSAIPVATSNFEWNIGATYSRLVENDVVEISKEYEVDRIDVGGPWGTVMPYMVHKEGERWGQLYGNGILRNDDGIPILSSSGFYQNDPNVFFGSVLPLVTGGIQNGFVFFKDFDLAVNIDYQFGGKFASLSNMWGSYSGLTARTAVLNDKGNPVRDAVADGGGVRVDGVDEDNNSVFFYVEAQDYYHNMFNNRTFDDFIYDLTFVKLREISLGYQVPVSRLNLGDYVKGAYVSVVARNPWLLYAKTKDFDPSEVSAVYGERGQLPGTRGIGFNIRLTF
ncbi:SusC/RagA family TonB-linked outer membrane protein [Parapedobacter sp. 2B3]|uniref:SusC/RagA family TonB-linked outer membrane protein n=1 Tax=Parapedobacter sp. 2B3 TaxID=3342381 RepID=UPI0035B5C045